MNSIARFLLTPLILILATASLFAQDSLQTRVQDFLYFTNNEVTEFGEIIWFWSEDEIFGGVFSNDVIGIKYNPVFHGPVITAADHFIQGPGYNPTFEVDPVFEADSLWDDDFVDAMSILEADASLRGNLLENGEGTLQTRILSEEEGWHLYQWPADQPFDESICTLNEIEPYGFSTYFVEGRLEVAGEEVRGQTTLACSDTMYLLDNITYPTLVDCLFTDMFGDDHRPYPGGGRLGLVAGSRMLVANTDANGRGNGLSDGPYDDHSTKHIVISANLAVPGGAFTFENHNNEPDDPFGWDGYWWCDPDSGHGPGPDERGSIYLYGSVAQYQRGYVHRSNCGGTGYDKEYRYDDRYTALRMPGLPDEHNIDLTQESVVWSDTTVVFDTFLDDYKVLVGEHPLIFGPGTTLEFDYENLPYRSMFTGGHILFEGTEDNPVVINMTGQYEPGIGTIPLFEQSQVLGDTLRHARFTGTTMRLDLPGVLDGVTIDGELVDLASNWIYLSMNRCRLHGAIRVDCHIRNLDHTLIEGTLTTPSLAYAEGVTFAHVPDILNNQLALAITQSPYPLINSLVNVAFYGGYQVLVQAAANTVVAYSSWYELLPGDERFSEWVTLGDGNLPDTDPHFWNPDEYDFHLTASSPLIDAGHPDSPLDPDGSRADIGAFSYDPMYDVSPDGELSTDLPTTFGIEALYPNPFNGMTTLSLTLPRSGEVEVAVFDLLGRQVEVLHRGVMRAGKGTLSLNLERQPSGLYFIVARMGSQRAVIKAMLVK